MKAAPSIMARQSPGVLGVGRSTGAGVLGMGGFRAMLQRKGAGAR